MPVTQKKNEAKLALDFATNGQKIRVPGFTSMFSIKNAVYVAITQVGVIVVGVLAAGLCFKARNDMGVHFPTAYLVLLNHTVIFLAIPPAWISGVLWIRSRADASDDVKNLAFWSGILLLWALVIFVFYADVTPWLNISWGLAGDEG